jgi:hypothetical protein
MDIKKLIFILSIFGIIVFPFLFSKKEITFQKSINLPNFAIKDAKFSIYKGPIQKKGEFKNGYIYNKAYVSEYITIKFFDKNSTLQAKKLVYNQIYNFVDATYKTTEYTYIANKGSYDEQNNIFTSEKFRFFNQKIEGKGINLLYKNDILTADNILYIIKDFDD